MKKQVCANTSAFSTITTLLLASSLFLAASQWASAQFTFTTNNGALTVSGWTRTGPTADIPAMFDGMPVVAIEAGAFTDAFFHGDDFTVSIPGTVTNIGAGVFTFWYSHSDSLRLTAINVDPSSGSFSSLDGVLLDKAQSVLIRCPAGKSGSFTIPNSVTNIAADAFAVCASLTTVTIPDSVVSIGAGAFAYTSLTSVSIPDSVTN